MYRNPYYAPFTEENGIKYYRSEYLTINGKFLNGASQESDVTVWIGTSACNVTSLSRLQLTCRPPTSQPPAEGKPNSNVIPDVIVGIGGKLNFTIGKLSYESNSNKIVCKQN
jgi:plexin A